MSKKETNSKSHLLKITQIKSPIARKYDQRATLIGLVLNKLHKSRVMNSNASIDGMINKVRHLLRIEIIG